jgi:HEAT repeat protein
LLLKDPGQRDKASQALIQLGPAATTAVLQYLDYPDEGVRKAARGVCRVLNVSDARRLEQTLADVADTRKGRVRVALESLTRMRPDGATRMKVSQALNAPLLDPDPAIRAEALDAVRVWGTPQNTGALVKLVEILTGDKSEGGLRTIAGVVQVLIALGPDVQTDVTPLLKSSDGLLRRQACYVLAEIGTGESLQPLQDAGKNYLNVDGEFYQLTQRAIAKIMARSAPPETGQPQRGRGGGRHGVSD